MSRVLAEAVLLCHESTPCVSLAAIGARIAMSPDRRLSVEFMAVGDPTLVDVPVAAPAVHTDELWRTTCFELFLAQSGDAYVELNFSPSGAFAAYHFDHYRTGMRALEMPAPAISIELGSERMIMSVQLGEDDLPWDWTGRIGISAVVAEKGGATSYWALAHPQGKPDFHHRDCFALQLPPVEPQ